MDSCAHNNLNNTFLSQPQGATAGDAYEASSPPPPSAPVPEEPTADSTAPAYSAGEPEEAPPREPNDDELLSSVFSQTNKLKESDRERIVAFLAKRAVLGPNERDVQQVCVCVCVCVCV